MAIFTAIGTAIAATFFAGSAIAASAISIGLSLAASFALSYAAKALAGKPQQSTDSFGVQGQLQGGGAVPRSFGFGYHVTAGSLVYANFFGQGYDTPNALQCWVIAVSDLPEKLVGMHVNGQKITLPAGAADYQTVGSGNLGYEVPEYIRPHNGEGAPTAHLWVKFYDGSQTAADAFLVSAMAATARPYANTRVGKGISYAVVIAFNDENLWNGFPTFKFELSGIALYDPSKDDTVGGSGTHRFNDPATWGGDGDNLPVVQAYAILRGIDYNGSWLYGLQNTAAARLPVANWITQIGKCRATVMGASGLEPTYRTGVQINVNAQPANALETLMTGCQGKISEVGGFYKCHVGAPDTPSFSFSDGDILSTEGQNFRPFFALADSVNGIQSTYPDPSQGWNTATAPAYYRTDLETRDGNRRLMANPAFDAVPYPEQVQRLQKSAVEEAQRARGHTIVLPPAFWIIEPGDVGEWTSARNGYSAKQFRVDGGTDKRNLDVVLMLTEVDPSDYGWDTSADFKPVTPGGTISNPPAPQGVALWDAQPYTLLDQTGLVRRPAVLISWDGTQPGCSGLKYEIRLASDGSSVTRGTVNSFSAGNRIITESILPATTYQVRGQYIPSLPRDMLWSDYVTVTTPDIRYSLAEFDAALKAQVTEIQDQMQAQIDEAVNRIAAIASEISSRTWLDKREVRSDLFAVAGDATARISSLETVVADDELAFANYQVTVSAQFATTNANVTTNASAIATLDDYAAAQYGVTLNVNGYATGFNLVNGGGGISSFTVVSDKFQIQLPGYNGGAPVAVFTTGTIGGVPSIGISGNVFLDGTLNASKIVAGSINTLQLAVNSVSLDNIIAGAVSNTQVFSTTAVSGVFVTTTFFSQAVTIRSGKATVIFTGEWQMGALNYGGLRPNPQIQLLVDGSVVKSFTWTMNYTPTGGNYEMLMPFTIEHTATGLSDGSHTFALRVVNTGSRYDLPAGQCYITDFRR